MDLYHEFEAELALCRGAVCAIAAAAAVTIAAPPRATWRRGRLRRAVIAGAAMAAIALGCGAGAAAAAFTMPQPGMSRAVYHVHHVRHMRRRRQEIRPFWTP